jgi:hypothetical protein
MKFDYTYTVDYNGENYTLESVFEDEDILEKGAQSLINDEIVKWVSKHFPYEKGKVPVFREILHRQMI